MPRLVYLAGWALVAVAGAFLLTDALLPPPEPGVTEANLRRVKEGMTLERVEAIFGAHGVDMTLRGYSDRSIWFFDARGGVAWVGIDRFGRVRAAGWGLVPLSGP